MLSTLSEAVSLLLQYTSLALLMKDMAVSSESLQTRLEVRSSQRMTFTCEPKRQTPALLDKCPIEKALRQAIFSPLVTLERYRLLNDEESTYVP